MELYETNFLLFIVAVRDHFTAFNCQLLYLFKRNKINTLALNIIKYNDNTQQHYIFLIKTQQQYLSQYFIGKRLQKALEPSLRRAGVIAESAISPCMIAQSAKNRNVFYGNTA